MARQPKTSWEGISDWYADYLARPGTMQAEIVFPKTARLLESSSFARHLDIACGEGGFAPHLLKKTNLAFTGIDASASLIRKANQRHLPNSVFMLADATHFAHLFCLAHFDSASCILAIQNIDSIVKVFQETAAVIKSGAPFVIVMNHPSFRQPRQSGWGWDEERKLQYRRVDRYLTSYEMPITAHPGSAPNIKTCSYHRSLEAYVQALVQCDFVIDALEEWYSNKISDSGPRAKAENIARREIPLFLAVRAKKV